MAHEHRDPRAIETEDAGRFHAAILDMDGVITDTASVHAKAWKQLFDAVLPRLSADPQAPFDAEADYLTYVDGRPRTGGIVTFLASRGITVDEGTPDDPADALTVAGMAKAKQEHFEAIIAADGVRLFDSTVALLRRMKQAGIPAALVSSSKNASGLIVQAGLSDLFARMVDGNEAARLGLPGKPAPDMFTTAAADIGVDPADAIVVEDAVSGVQSARAGNFGLVLGLRREGTADRLYDGGADVVVDDLAEIDVARLLSPPA